MLLMPNSYYTCCRPTELDIIQHVFSITCVLYSVHRYIERVIFAAVPEFDMGKQVFPCSSNDKIDTFQCHLHPPSPIDSSLILIDSSSSIAAHENDAHVDAARNRGTFRLRQPCCHT